MYFEKSVKSLNTEQLAVLCTTLYDNLFELQHGQLIFEYWTYILLKYVNVLCYAINDLTVLKTG